MKIPKLIHYCWFGNNEKSDLIMRCIDSWKKYMPEYKIIEWNENNFDISQNNYCLEAYQARKWAFVADYARCWIIEKYGGIYFDTDVELLKSIPDVIIENNAFLGRESAGLVAPGLVYGSIAHHILARKMLDKYNREHFIINGKENLLTINVRVTELLKEMGYEASDKLTFADDIAIYPPEYFCGYDMDVHESAITSNTISIHHYDSSWKKKRTLKYNIQEFIKWTIGVEGYRRVLTYYRILKNRGAYL